MEDATNPQTHDQDLPPAIYYPVSVLKFAVLAVLTWGIYEIYWFYKNWKYVRDRDEAIILPFWRAVFSIVWYYPLLKDMRQLHSDKSLSRGTAFFLASLFAILWLTRTLPNPFWLPSLLGFILLLPAVKAINAINPQKSPHYARHSAWKLRHNILLLVAGPLTFFAIGESSGLLPSSDVVPGGRLWPHQRSFLVKSNIVNSDERILYFYSDALFSIQGDGNLLTNRHVISYWEDEETGELFIEKVLFAEIADVQVEFGDWADPAYVTITRNDGSNFTLLLSSDRPRVRAFLHRLDQLRRES